MDITVSGHQTATGDAFRARVDERLQGIAQKYFARAMGATVTLKSGPHDAGFVCDIVMHVRQGLVLKGSNRGVEANPAFDGAAERIEKQLRRYARKLKPRGVQPMGGPEEPDGPVAAHAFDNANYAIFQPLPDEADAGAEDDETASPLVVAETRVDIPDAAVADAVMMLDLRNTTALMFKNARTGAYNMVYRREDGNIGWVEPR